MISHLPTPASETVHGCAVAVGEVGLLITGASGIGKSRLVTELLSTWTNPDVRLVADDRVILSLASGRLVARPHPAIAGQIECRGIGILSMDWLEAIVLQGVFRLDTEFPARMPEKQALSINLLGVSLPCFTSPVDAHTAARLRMILPFLRGKTATYGA